MKTILGLLKDGVVGVALIALLASCLTWAVMGEYPISNPLFALFFTLVGVGVFYNSKHPIRYFSLGIYLLGFVLLLTSVATWVQVSAAYFILMIVVFFYYTIPQNLR